MDSPNQQRTSTLLERYLDPGASWSVSLDAELRQLVRDHEACAEAYDRAVTVHRLMVGAEPTLPSGFERKRMTAVLLAPLPTPSPFLKAWSWSWLRPGVLGLAGVALALLVVVRSPVVVPLVESGTEEDYIGAKGGGFFDLTVGIGVSGVREDGLEYEAIAGDSRLYLNDYLRIYTTRVVDNFPLAIVVGLQPERAPIWYAPDPEHESFESTVVEMGRSVPLGGELEPFEFRLSGRHVAGPLRVVAVFTAAPLTVEQVGAVLEDVRTEGALEERMTEALGLETSGVVRVLDLRVAPGSKGDVDDTH
jgi:hypothetical protein